MKAFLQRVDMVNMKQQRDTETWIAPAISLYADGWKIFVLGLLKSFVFQSRLLVCASAKGKSDQRTALRITWEPNRCVRSGTVCQFWISN